MGGPDDYSVLSADHISFGELRSPLSSSLLSVTGLVQAGDDTHCTGTQRSFRFLFLISAMTPWSAMTTAAIDAVRVVPMQIWFQFLFLISAMTLWPVMMAEAVVTVTAFLLYSCIQTQAYCKVSK